MGNFETKNNNLNEIFIANPQPNNNDSFKFYTCPEDYSHYRSCNPFTNFSFTPFSPHFGDVYPMNYFNPGGFPVFPTIRENKETIDLEENLRRESSKEKEE
jgi:hypothetical protein